MMISIVFGAPGTISKGLVKGTGRFGNKRTSGDYPDYGQNTEKSPGDLRRLAIIQTPIENYQLMLE